MGRFNELSRMLPPAARRADPITSHEADHAITHSGHRGSEVHKAAQMVIDKAGSTSRELADHFKVDNDGLHKRLSDAAAAGLIKQGGKRVCLMSKRGLRAVTWWPKGYVE